MGYLPIEMDITDRPCLVIGGGEVALRKVLSLIEAGGRVTVISPQINEHLNAMAGIVIEEREYKTGDCAGFTLVFAGTNNRSVNVAISTECQSRGIAINVVDDPELCSFIVPASVRRGDLIISVSSSGKSPVLSKRIRRELEHQYGDEYEQLLNILGEMRGLVREKYATQPQREAVFNQLLDCGILELLREGKTDEARLRAMECI